MTHTDSDKDLRSVQEARRLADRCRLAQREFSNATAQQVDAICEAMAEAAYREAASLGRLANEETGYGIADDKTVKNQFSSKTVWESIRNVATVGIIARDEEKMLLEIAEPMGVVAALTPSTNPTSTAMYKILIAVKARNGIVVSPHPSALRCTAETVRIMTDAAEGAGAPRGLISCLEEGHFAGTDALMKHYAVSVILATGGSAMVRAAHSVGKPAYGVGPGNVPVWVDKSADIAKAARDIVSSKSFDCSLICASEQSVVADRTIADELRRCMEMEGAFWIDDDAARKLGTMLFTSGHLPNTKYVGKTALKLAAEIGLSVPPDTRVLVAPLTEIGPKQPLSREKLTSVLGFMMAADADQGLETCISILRFGGDGHSAVVHARNRELVERMAVRLPAFRIIVNSMATLGSVGMTTGFSPAMTLATGGMGGSITGDNITIEHLMNVKRVGWERTPWQGNPRKRGAESGHRPVSAEQVEAIVAAVLSRLERSSGVRNRSVAQ